MAKEQSNLRIVQVYRTWFIDSKYVVADELPDNWSTCEAWEKEVWLKNHGIKTDRNFEEYVGVDENALPNWRDYIELETHVSR